MTQMAIELTDPIYGFLRNKRYLILDNDILFKDRFSSMLEDEGVKVVHTGYQAPDMNAFAERWVRSIKTECLIRESATNSSRRPTSLRPAP